MKKTGDRSQETGVRRSGLMISVATIWMVVVMSIASLAQTPAQYNVVRVVGSVESPTLKRLLKTGDVIQSKDHLKFGTKESYIIVNSPQTGRKRISGVPDNSPREFLQLLQSFVQPELKSTSGRGVSREYVDFLMASMTVDTLLVLGEGFIPINTAKLSLTKPAAVKAWHHDSKKKVKYVVISGETGIKLDRATLFGDHHGIITKVVIEYFENEEEDPMFNPGLLLGAFVPLYMNEVDLAPEIRALISASDKTNQKAILSEVNNYLRDEYAPAQEDNLKAWLKEQKIIE